MRLYEAYVQFLPLLFGALIGSFLNVVIVRWPEGKSIVTPRSACTRCGYQLTWYDNIPILSFLFLRAKCRKCGEPISWRYPLVEALTAGLSWLTFQHFVPNLWAIAPVQVAQYLFFFALVAGLIAITFIDLDTQYIPDVISLPGIVVGLAGSLIFDRLGVGIVSWQSAVLGALVGGGSLLLLRGVYYLIRRQEGMGMGDVKLLAMLGAFLGAHPALLFIVFVSSFLGSAVGITLMILYRKDMKLAVPFGPFLAAGALLYLFWGQAAVPSLLGFRLMELPF